MSLRLNKRHQLAVHSFREVLVQLHGHLVLKSIAVHTLLLSLRVDWLWETPFRMIWTKYSFQNDQLIWVVILVQIWWIKAFITRPTWSSSQVQSWTMFWFVKTHVLWAPWVRVHPWPYVCIIFLLSLSPISCPNLQLFCQLRLKKPQRYLKKHRCSSTCAYCCDKSKVLWTDCFSQVVCTIQQWE